jgi:secondary thiamine-phosphate synthase enzyme
MHLPAPSPFPALSATSAALRLRTAAPVELIDITPRLQDFVRRSRLGTGWLNVQVLHTTASLAINEDEPLLRSDLLRLLERLAPSAAPYAHDELHRRRDIEPGERPNGHAHAKALLLRTSETLNVVGGALQLGRWQRVFLMEMDGPRERELSLVALGDGLDSGVGTR